MAKKFVMICKKRGCETETFWIAWKHHGSLL